MDTASLIERCQEGDKSALGLLYDAYSKQMMRVVCHYVIDWQAAQDILHDGFLIIFSRINQLRDNSKLEYWMAAIMKNLSLQYLKEQDITTILAADFDIPDVPEFEESITMDELEAMINRLPSGYQKVFRLAVLEHKTHREIGKLLGISEGTSGSQLFHARVMIRQMIIEHKLKTGLILAVIALSIGILVRINSTEATEPVMAEIDEPSVIIATLHTDELEEITDTPSTIVTETIVGKSDNIAETVSEKSIPNVDVTDNLMVETEQSNDSAVHTSMPQMPIPTTVFDNKIAATSNKGLNLSISGSFATSLQRNEALGYFSPSSFISAGGTDKKEKINHDMPITLLLVISKALSNRWSIESGIQYTILQTNRTNLSNFERIKVQYLGIPLKLQFGIISTGKFAIYANAGTMLELPIAGTFYQTDNGNWRKSTFSPPKQWSVSSGIGLEYTPTPHIGIFAEPSINYYFKAYTRYPTIRQDRPLELTIPIGLRYKW